MMYVFLIQDLDSSKMKSWWFYARDNLGKCSHKQSLLTL